MKRSELDQLFVTKGPAVLPVIHVINNEQVKSNVDVILAAGCPGFFLINHDFKYSKLLPIIVHVKEKFPSVWMGVNFLGINGAEAFPILEKLKYDGVNVDAYWADDARIDEKSSEQEQAEAEHISLVLKESDWDGLYFGGTAFKKQREVAPKDFYISAQLACHFMDVVTTSGAATGEAADISKIKTFRKACRENAIALASGITEKNVLLYAPYVDAFLVATGINFENNFYNIDSRRLFRLIEKLR